MKTKRWKPQARPALLLQHQNPSDSPNLLTSRTIKLFPHQEYICVQMQLWNNLGHLESDWTVPIQAIEGMMCLIRGEMRQKCEGNQACNPLKFALGLSSGIFHLTLYFNLHGLPLGQKHCIPKAWHWQSPSTDVFLSFLQAPNPVLGQSHPHQIRLDDRL